MTCKPERTRALHADPQWRASWRERFDEGWANRQGLAGRRYSGGTKLKFGTAVQLGFAVEPEIRDALRMRALKNRVSLSEQIRTYIQWGLDVEDTTSP